MASSTQLTVSEVLQRSMRGGLIMGLYLCLTSMCFLVSVDWQSSLTVMLGLIICLPFITVSLMRRQALLDSAMRKYSAQWLYGIYCFIFGSLIAGLFTAVYLLFINRGFFSMYLEQVMASIDTLRSQGDPRMADALAASVSNIHISPMQFVISMIWQTSFTGAVISALCAAYMQLPHVRRRFTPTLND